MPNGDQAVTGLPVEAPAANDAFWYIKDPGGLPAARRCSASQLILGAFSGTGNIRIDDNGNLTILVEGDGRYWQIRARLNPDEEGEMYLQAPTSIGGEGGEALGGEGGELIGEE